MEKNKIVTAMVESPMAEGIDNQTFVVVELEASLAVAYLDQVLQPLLAIRADSIIINIQARQEVVQKRSERIPSSPDLKIEYGKRRINRSTALVVPFA